MKPRPSLRLLWFRTRALRAASTPSVLVLVAINLSAALLYLWASSAGAPQAALSKTSLASTQPFLDAAAARVRAAAAASGGEQVETPPPRSSLLTLRDGPLAGPRLAVVVGVMTTAASPHRGALRAAWFGDSGAAGPEADLGVVVRFVVGRDRWGGRAVAVMLEEEHAVHADLMGVNVVDGTPGAPFLKTLAFLRAAVREFNADYYARVQDDTFVRLDRLPVAVRQWADDGGDYVGCLNLGSSRAEGDCKFFAYMQSSMFALSERAAIMLASRPDAWLRKMPGGDDACSVGINMLALSVRHTEDSRLCHDTCYNDTIAVAGTCGVGACDAVDDLARLHASPDCHAGEPEGVGALWAKTNYHRLTKKQAAAVNCYKLVGDRLRRDECEALDDFVED